MPPYQPTQISRYKTTLAELMSFKLNQHYTRDHDFTQHQLLSITDVDVSRWMCLKAYGDPDPAPANNPTVGRASSLAYYKKAISYFMPNRHVGWDVQHNTGNPTRSPRVMDVLKAVKKKEVRRQGRPSLARRPIEIEEFRQIMDLCVGVEEDNQNLRYFLPSFFKYQFHMMARFEPVTRPIEPSTEYTTCTDAIPALQKSSIR
jgi:hypothetical protein